MNWFEQVVNGIKDFFEWLGSDKTLQTVQGILRLVILVAGVVEKFNAPLSGEERARLVRQMVLMLRYASAQELAELTTLIAFLAANPLQVSRLRAWEIDKLVGDGIAAYIATRGTPASGDCPEVERLKEQY
jgi:hypothetical protein